VIQALNFAVDATAPILIVLLLGIVLRRLNLIDDRFIQQCNCLVFNITLPCMLFFAIVAHPIGQVIDARLLLFTVFFTLIFAAGLWLLMPNDSKRGVRIQGAFRGNLAIVGVALVLNIYGETLLPRLGVFVGLMTLVYNLLSVTILAYDQDRLLQRVVSNPLICAVCLGLLGSVLQVQIPSGLQTAGAYVSGITLPLALICIGASLKWQSLRINHHDVIISSILKIVASPLLACLFAIVLGFRQENLAIIFLMTASPTAAASYVMAQQMTDYGSMAAEIIALSTLLSVFSITFGLFILLRLGFI